MYKRVGFITFDAGNGSFYMKRESGVKPELYPQL